MGAVPNNVKLWSVVVGRRLVDSFAFIPRMMCDSLLILLVTQHFREWRLSAILKRKSRRNSLV
jgi:hypothetical protein